MKAATIETETLSNDINVFYVTAKSFPEGIMDAQTKIHSLAPTENRKFFGISRPEKGGAIVYKAAAEETQPGEAAKLNCETMVIKKGKYICETIHHYAKDKQSIKKAFDELLEQPGIDPTGYCVEWYVNDTDVKCMVRLKA